MSNWSISFSSIIFLSSFLLQISVLFSFSYLIAYKTALMKLLCSTWSFKLNFGTKLSLNLFTFSAELSKSSISGSSSELSHKLKISSKFLISCKPFSYSFFHVSLISASTLSLKTYIVFSLFIINKRQERI